MNDKTQDPLARWWWPGQWLHIVYGVWIDQLWYWKNVRPRMQGWRQGWKISIQGLLGAALIVFIVSAITGEVLLGMGIEVRWTLLALGVGVIALVSAIVGSIVASADGLPTSLAYTVTFCTTFGIPLCVDLGTGMIGPTNLVIAILGALVGMAFGVARGLVKGVVFSIGWDLIVAGIMALSLALRNGIPITIIMLVAFCFGFGVGGLWAIRQVPDINIRKRLANPDAFSSAS